MIGHTRDRATLQYFSRSTDYALSYRATPRRREMDVPDKYEPHAQPRAEQFDALVRELLPKIRLLSPQLSEVEALRAAARMAEYRLNDEETLIWGWP